MQGENSSIDAQASFNQAHATLYILTETQTCKDVSWLASLYFPRDSSTFIWGGSQTNSSRQPQKQIRYSGVDSRTNLFKSIKNFEVYATVVFE